MRIKMFMYSDIEGTSRTFVTPDFDLFSELTEAAIVYPYKIPLNQFRWSLETNALKERLAEPARRNLSSGLENIW